MLHNWNDKRKEIISGILRLLVLPFPLYVCAILIWLQESTPNNDYVLGDGVLDDFYRGAFIKDDFGLAASIIFFLFFIVVWLWGTTYEEIYEEIIEDPIIDKISKNLKWDK